MDLTCSFLGQLILKTNAEGSQTNAKHTQHSHSHIHTLAQSMRCIAIFCFVGTYSNAVFAREVQQITIKLCLWLKIKVLFVHGMYNGASPYAAIDAFINIEGLISSVITNTTTYGAGCLKLQAIKSWNQCQKRNLAPSFSICLGKNSRKSSVLVLYMMVALALIAALCYHTTVGVA